MTAPPPPPALACRGLRRAFGRITAVDGLDVAIVCSPMLTALCVNGEEGWDLLRLSPTPEVRLRRAKVAAGMTLPVLIAAALCATAAAGGHLRAAVIALPLGTLCAGAFSWFQASTVKPAKRSALLGRGGNRMRSPILALLVAGAAWAGLFLVGSPELGKVLIGSALLFLLVVAMALMIGLIELRAYSYPDES